MRLLSTSESESGAIAGVSWSWEVGSCRSSRCAGGVAGSCKGGPVLFREKEGVLAGDEVALRSDEDKARDVSLVGERGVEAR